MTNEEKIEKMLVFFHGSRTLKDLLLEMAEWKDKCLQTVIDGIKESYQLDSSVIFICDLIEQRYKDKFK